MNGRKAKALRRVAEQAMLEWYKTLVEEDQKELLTVKLVKEYTPVVKYYTKDIDIEHDGKLFVAQQVLVSENTQRWFYRTTKMPRKLERYHDEH